MLSVKTKKEEQIESLLDEILDKNISVETFQETAAKSLETAEYEKVNSLLLEHYNKAQGYNFQDSLKKELKAMVNEKILSKLENTDDLEKSKDKKINEIGNEENVDKDTLEKAKNKIDDKNKSEQENKEFNLREELMKQVYIEEFKNYSNRLLELKEIQADKKRSAFEKSEGVSLTIGEKAGYEIVLYEKYLQNLERNFKGNSNIYKFNSKELNEIEEVKEIKEDLVNKLKEKEEYIDYKVDNRLNELKELYTKREEVAKQISEIADNKLLQQNPAKFKEEMDRLQEEYRNLTYEMREKDPTLEKYNEMIRIEQENKDFAKRELGVNSEVGFSSGYSKEQETLDIDSKTVEEQEKHIEQKKNTNNKEILDDLTKEAALCISQGMYDKAEEYLQSVEDILEIQKNEKDEAEGKQSKVSSEELDKYIDKNVNKKDVEEINQEEKNAKDPLEYKDPFDLRYECNDTKIEENDLNKKLELKTRLKIAQEKYNELYPNKEKDENIQEGPVRY